MFIKSSSFHYLLKCVFIKVLSTAKLNGFFRGQNLYRQLSKSATRTMMNHRMQFLTSLLNIATIAETDLNQVTDCKKAKYAFFSEGETMNYPINKPC